jgi:hypothetical protein
MVKSFFDPDWPDLGVLGVFGRWMEINWVWAEMLIIYHAVFSIVIPVLLVELAYPSQRKERWVGSRGLGGFAILLAGVVFLGYFAMTPYRPPLPQYFSAFTLDNISQRLHWLSFSFFWLGKFPLKIEAKDLRTLMDPHLSLRPVFLEL